MKLFKDYLKEVPDDHKQEIPSYACMTAYIHMLNDMAKEIRDLKKKTKNMTEICDCGWHFTRDANKCENKYHDLEAELNQ